MWVMCKIRRGDEIEDNINISVEENLFLNDLIHFSNVI